MHSGKKTIYIEIAHLVEIYIIKYISHAKHKKNEMLIIAK